MIASTSKFYLILRRWPKTSDESNNTAEIKPIKNLPVDPKDERRTPTLITFCWKITNKNNTWTKEKYTPNIYLY